MFCPPSQRRNAPAPAPTRHVCGFNATGTFCNVECGHCETIIRARGAANIRRSRILTARLMRVTPSRH